MKAYCLGAVVLTCRSCTSASARAVSESVDRAHLEGYRIAVRVAESQDLRHLVGEWPYNMSLCIPLSSARVLDAYV